MTTARAARPRALKINAATRGFDLDENGRYIEVHPVDAAVATALLHIQGRIRCAPSTGAAWNQIVDPFSPRAAQMAEYLARAALRRLILRGEITLVRVRFEPMPSGSKVEVTYVNERLSPRQERTASSG